VVITNALDAAYVWISVGLAAATIGWKSWFAGMIFMTVQLTALGFTIGQQRWLAAGAITMLLVVFTMIAVTTVTEQVVGRS